MPNVTGTFDSLKGHNDALIRKMLEMAIFIAPWPAAVTLATISDTAGTQLVIPDTYLSVGMCSKDDGATWTPNIDISEVGAYGYGTAVRRDATSRTLNLGFTMLETKKKVLELYYGVDLSATTVPAAKTELFFDMPSAARASYWRVLAIGKDGTGTNAIYHAEYLPKAILTDVDAVSWTDDSPLSYSVTLSADVDSTYGTSQRSFWCGPGFNTSVITAMGFSQLP
jgi:hypothetical protein